MWSRVRALLGSPLRIATFASLAFFFFGSAWLLARGLADGDGQSINNGAIGVALMAFLAWVVVRGFESIDRHDARRPPRPATIPFWQRPSAALLTIDRTVGTSYFRDRLLGVLILIFVGGMVGLWVATNDREWVTLAFWLATIVLFGVLITLAVGMLTTGDERRRRNQR